jgi:transcription-repair coupling factor (superfamily II helicase)
VESGLDIPNANTIFIEDAHRFGLAELYQLRGRVGRYNQQAFAYLLLPGVRGLPKNARERLAAIRRYTHLGAGFKLALRDLEIRGAGNLLGTNQSGHIAAVGFDLYCDLLEGAVDRLHGEPAQRAASVSVAIEFVRFGHAVVEPGEFVVAALPPDWITNEDLRIVIYKRAGQLKSMSEAFDFEAELIDRFGRLPESAANFCKLLVIRTCAAQLEGLRLNVKRNRVLLETMQGQMTDQNGYLPVLQAETAADKLLELEELLRTWVAEN